MRDVDPLNELRDDPALHAVVTSLRELPPDDPAAVRRIVQTAMRDGPSVPYRAMRPTASRMWRFAGAMAAATGLVWIGYAAGHRSPRTDRPVASANTNLSWGTTAQPASNAPNSSANAHTPFRLDAPAARQVALVGDFNGWDPSATMMQRSADGRTWTADVALRAGRHTYAFVVDGLVIADPDVPSVRDPDYDVPVSAVVVREP